MTTSVDTKLAAATLSLLDTLGTNMVFVVPTSSYYDPATQTQVVKTPTNVPRKASPPMQYSSRLIAEGVVRRDDAQIFIAASGLTFTPVEGMKLTHAGLTWNMVTASPLYSGDDVAAWECQIRR